MNYLNGKIYHFRDNVTGLEVDTILEFENGEYAAVEKSQDLTSLMKQKNIF